MTEKAMVFPRRDDGPQVTVGKSVAYQDRLWRSTKIKVFTGPRKALRCVRSG